MFPIYAFAIFYLKINLKIHHSQHHTCNFVSWGEAVCRFAVFLHKLRAKGGNVTIVHGLSVGW